MNNQYTRRKPESLEMSAFGVIEEVEEHLKETGDRRLTEALSLLKKVFELLNGYFDEAIHREEVQQLLEQREELNKKLRGFGIE